MILFYLKETFRIFKKSSFATMITITITTIAVLLATVSFFLVFSVNRLSDQIKRSIEINVYLDDSLSAPDVETIVANIRSVPAVLSVNFVNKNDAIARFVEETGEDFRNVLDQNPLPNSLTVKFKPEPLNEQNIEKFTDQFKKLHGVTDVVYDYRTVLKILSMLKSVEYIIYLLSVTLILLSVYLVYSNNKIQMYGNRELYVTMKLVGAKISTMKVPIILNGIFIGAIASIIGWGFIKVILMILTNTTSLFKLNVGMQILNLLVPFIGVSLGFIGSFISSFKIAHLLEEK